MGNRELRLLMATLALSCSGGGGKDDTADGVDECASPGAIVVTDANNYSYAATFDLTVVDVRAQADILVTWNAVTQDIRGRPLDPTTVEEFTFSRVTMTPDELAEAVVSNTLDQGDIADFRQFFPTTEVEVNISQTSIIGNPLVPETEFLADPGSTWLATLWKSSPDGRNDILMSVGIRPVDGEVVERVDMTNTSSVLTLDPDLVSLVSPSTCEGLTYTVDWTGLVNDANGNPFDERSGDRMIIGKVNRDTVEEVEDVFLTLFEEASELYYLDVYGLRYAELNGDVSRVGDDGLPVVPRALDGTPFPGFTKDGIWLIGIECLTCTSPTPLFLTVVDVG